MSEPDLKPQPGICPQCCRPIRPDRVTVDLRYNVVHFRGGQVKLRPTEAEIVYVLARHMPDVVPHQTILARLCGAATGRAANELGAMRDHVCKARNRIGPLGLSIAPSWGVGYFLYVTEPDGGAPDAATQAAVPALIQMAA